jgi:hypothetical protein
MGILFSVVGGIGIEMGTYLRSNNPSNSPTWKSESLGQTINDQHIVLIHIINILRRGNGSAVTVWRVIVPAIELIHDKRCSVTADILNLCELRVLDYSSGRIPWVRSENDWCSTWNLLSDLVRVDVIAIWFGQGSLSNGDVSKNFLWEDLIFRDVSRAMLPRHAWVGNFGLPQHLQGIAANYTNLISLFHQEHEEGTLRSWTDSTSHYTPYNPE